MIIEFKSLGSWPKAETRGRRYAPFRVGYNRIVDGVQYELEKLGANKMEIGLAISPSEIRRDGLPYANAKPRMPGVIVMAPTRFGRRQWACDRFTGWTDNLWAIGLTLERLRLCDLYGVTSAGEQYAGFAPPAPDASMPWDGVEAADLLARYSGLKASAILADPEQAQRAYRLACKATHPDSGGNAKAFEAVRRAGQLVRRAT